MKMHVHRYLAPFTALVLPVALLLPAGAGQAINVGGTTNLAPLVAKAATGIKALTRV